MKSQCASQCPASQCLTGPTLITIKEFASRIMVSYWTAREISQQDNMREKGIIVKINNKKNGGIRINWTKYLSQYPIG